MSVCDDCLLVAYDELPTNSTSDEQAYFMKEMGSVIEDHRCGAVEDPEYVSCDCDCRRHHDKKFKHPMGGICG